jgi:hypothetical protein
MHVISLVMYFAYGCLQVFYLSYSITLSLIITPHHHFTYDTTLRASTISPSQLAIKIKIVYYYLLGGERG